MQRNISKQTSVKKVVPIKIKLFIKRENNRV